MTWLSPHDLAEALGVSESSLKRWIDAGRIRATRTEGGHRRVALADALAFIRETHAQVVQPELLGLPAATPGPTERAPSDRARRRSAEDTARALRGLDELSLSLHDGDAGAVAARLRDAQHSGASIAALCDGPIRRAMHAIGELWQHDPDGVVIEHRATDACMLALASLRASIAAPDDAPIALGGAPEDDPYLLPSAMAALVLAAEGFRTVNLGPDTPTQAMHRAVAHHRPRLVWISASAPLPVAQSHDIAGFLAGLPPEVASIVGGRHVAAVADADPRVPTAASMTELAALARGLSPRRAPAIR